MTRRPSVAGSSLAIFLVLLLAASFALANGQAKPGAQAAAEARGLAYTGGRGAAGPISRGRFTLEFVDADLVDVFQALATQSGVNIALSGSVKGKTTLRLRNVTIEQAMNIVTKLNGLDYAWVDAAYVVGTPEEVRAMRVSELRSAVVVLQHLKPEYAQEVLSKLTPDVTVSTQKGVRSILLLGTEASLAKAERALAEMDVAGPPSPPVSKVVPVRYMKADQMAEMITAAVPEITVQPGPQENSLLITANDQQWETIDSMLSVSDVAPKAAQATQAVYYVKYTSPTELQKTLSELLPDLAVSLAPRTYTPVVQKATGGAGGTAQILAAPQYAGGGGAGGGGTGGAGGAAGVTIEAAPVTALILSGGPYTVERGLKLLEQLDRAPKQVHIEAIVTEVNRDDVSRLGIDWFDLGVAGAPVTVGEAGAVDEARGLQVGKISRTPLQWRAAIHALEETSRARILSKPSVTTLDGRQTALHTGDSIYYLVALAASAAGGVITTTQTVDTGISLLVNPRVNDNGEVTLTIAPSVSSATFGSSGLPIVTEQAVVTTVRVKSGETAVLAGLVSDKERVFISKVPFLGDIPLAGELFKYRRKSPAHQELLIFVTPTIIEN